MAPRQHCPDAEVELLVKTEDEEGDHLVQNASEPNEERGDAKQYEQVVG